MLAYAKKALVAAALSCIAVILSWNVPSWIDGSETFQWRAVLAGLVAAFISGLATFYATNKPVPPA
jgi:hypothetical protein